MGTIITMLGIVFWHSEITRPVQPEIPPTGVQYGLSE